MENNYLAYPVFDSQKGVCFLAESEQIPYNKIEYQEISKQIVDMDESFVPYSFLLCNHRPRPGKKWK